jgi:hypothetical protein
MAVEAWLDHAVPTDYAVATVTAMRAGFEQAVAELEKTRSGPADEQAVLARDALDDALVGLKADDIGRVKNAAHALSGSEFMRAGQR